MQSEKGPCKLLTHHAHVLLYLDAHPDEPLRKVALAIGMTERAVQLIVADLEAAGYLSREKVGRQNRYTIRSDGAMRHPLESDLQVGDFLRWTRSAGENEADADPVLQNWGVGEHGSEVRT